MTLWRDGHWQQAPPGWSDPRTYQLAPPDLSRRAALIGAPDLLLFPPEYFGARTVEFRAGLELGIMQHSLAVWSWLRARNLAPPNPARFTRLFHRVAGGWMEPLGTDRGGMVVHVAGGGGETHSWTLLAEAGDGPPFIPPAIPALITLGKLARGGEVPAGARPPALDLFTLDEAQTALGRLNVSFQRGG